MTDRWLLLEIKKLMQTVKELYHLILLGNAIFCIMNVGREREIPPDYCYKKLDQIALKQMTNNCRNKSFA